MSETSVIFLDRTDYIDSTATISDEKSRRFALMAQKWWDKHERWESDRCMVLQDSCGVHLAYLFFNVHQHGRYLTVHNIFTPLLHRHHGYATLLLSMMFESLRYRNIERFKLSCVPASLPFYAQFGLVYWGINAGGSYFCDLPFPKEGLEGIASMVLASSDKELIGTQTAFIVKRIHNSYAALGDAQQLTHRGCKERLGSDYRFDAFETLCDQKITE